MIESAEIANPTNLSLKHSDIPFDGEDETYVKTKLSCMQLARHGPEHNTVEQEDLPSGVRGCGKVAPTQTCFKVIISAIYLFFQEIEKKRA